MNNLQKYYINGSWVNPSSKREFPVVNPANQETITSIYLANEADVDSAVAAAKLAFESFSQISKEEQSALLEKLLVTTKARMEDLAQAISQEMVLPLPWL